LRSLRSFAATPWFRLRRAGTDAPYPDKPLGRAATSELPRMTRMNTDKHEAPFVHSLIRVIREIRGSQSQKESKLTTSLFASLTPVSSLLSPNLFSTANLPRRRL
jgi:hypothetical protein